MVDRLVEKEAHVSLNIIFIKKTKHIKQRNKKLKKKNKNVQLKDKTSAMLL